MNNAMIIARIFLIGMGLLLTACTSDLQLSRIESGRLLEYGRGGVVVERQLTKEQAAALTDWLRINGQGWSFDFNSYAPDILLFLKHEDGTGSGLYVYDSWVASASARQLKRSFPKAETDKLRVLLGLRPEKQ